MQSMVLSTSKASNHLQHFLLVQPWTWVHHGHDLNLMLRNQVPLPARLSRHFGHHDLAHWSESLLRRWWRGVLKLLRSEWMEAVLR